jgi:vacuolar-type H+-ATPase subunit H
MIQELIDKIAEAEKKADETVAAAHEEAREISLNAEARRQK